MSKTQNLNVSSRKIGYIFSFLFLLDFGERSHIFRMQSFNPCRIAFIIQNRVKLGLDEEDTNDGWKSVEESRKDANEFGYDYESDVTETPKKLNKMEKTETKVQKDDDKNTEKGNCPISNSTHPSLSV